MPADLTTGRQGRFERAVPVLVLLLAAGLIFTGLGANSLHNRDEARHALVAQDILATGDWLTLTHAGQPYFNKPPLKFWLTALTFRAWGVSELTARLWSALFALGAVALTGLLGTRLYGRRTGWLAAAILATSTGFLYGHCARSGELDSALLCGWVLAAWLAAGSVARPSRFILAGAAAGLCGMVKHLGMAAEVLAILYLWAAASGAWRRLGARALGGALAAALLVAAPWHLAMTLRHGSAFWSGYFGREVVVRAFTYTGSVSGPTWLAILIKDGLFPWSALLPLALWQALRGGGSPARRPGLLPAVWIAVVTAVVMVGRIKLPWYGLPLHPPLAIVLAGCLLAWARERPTAGTGLAWVLAWLVIALSPSNAAVYNPFAHHAFDGWVGTDLFGLPRPGGLDDPFGLLQAGVALTGLAATLAALGVGRRLPPDGPAAARARLAGLLALGGLALAIAAAPLRGNGTQSPLAQLAATLPARDDLAGAPVRLLMDPGSEESDLPEFYRRRMAAALAARPGGPARVGRHGAAADTLGLLDTRTAPAPDGAVVVATVAPWVIVRLRPAATAEPAPPR